MQPYYDCHCTFCFVSMRYCTYVSAFQLYTQLIMELAPGSSTSSYGPVIGASMHDSFLFELRKYCAKFDLTSWLWILENTSTRCTYTKIHEYAECSSDKLLLGLVRCHKLVAVEAKYHKFCYKCCTRLPSKVSEAEDEILTDDPGGKALNFVIRYIWKEVILLCEVAALSDKAWINVAKLIELG